MSFMLMMVGILATALGATLIGFGIPINEFSLGNTLILSGTITASGGVIIFAISRAVSQLSRIADILGTRPRAPAMPVANDSYEPSQPDRSAPQRTPSAARGRSDAQRASEPRLPSGEFDMPADVEPVRPPPSAGPRGGFLAGEDQDEVSLSPRTPRSPAAPDTSSPAGWRPPRPAADPRQRANKPVMPDPRRATTPLPGSDNPFEAAWPNGRKPASAARREPVVDQAPESAPDAKTEPVSVLKSGIVDGMAYTLYTDGSIEAELAQGVVRFGSIEELRNHLEKSA